MYNSPCLSPLPSGWEWSLGSCTEALIHAVVVGEWRRGIPRSFAGRQVLRPGVPSPHVQPGLPVLAGYVDNDNYTEGIRHKPPSHPL